MLARAVVFHEVGGPDVLRVEQIDVPEPGPGEIRIRVEAFGLNRSEAMFREGWHPVKPALPSRIGYEAASTVESIGPAVTGFAVGDRVATLPIMDLNRHGCHGELATVPAALVVKAAPELTAVENAALWSSYMTVYGALVDLVPVRNGDFVLVTAASSGVGPPAIQILNMLGARPIAVTRRREKAPSLRAAGAFAAIVTEDEDLLSRVMEITGGAGVPVVFDPIGGPGVVRLADATAPYGRIILYGVLDFDPAPLPLAALIQKNLSILGYAMYLHDRPDRTARSIAFIRDGVAAGVLKPAISRVFALADIVEAARYLDSMQQIGKVVVKVA
jgi:NADPH:quinone reductase-like Zn-dependent oxidoreductase